MPSLSLKGRALKYLAAREHSRLELERKLAPHCEDADEIARVLDQLEVRGLLSQQRFVDSVLHRRAARHGASRIRHELQSKGVTGELLDAAIGRLHGSEYDRARQAWARRFEAPATDAKERARQARFLLSRGFAAEVVHRVVRFGDDDRDAVQAPPDEA